MRRRPARSPWSARSRRSDSFVVAAAPRRRRGASSARPTSANGRTSASTNSTSGWSGRGGLTKNPYVLDRNPSGSSSGSAVAVAASLCAVAVGTETNGSIISPVHASAASSASSRRSAWSAARGSSPSPARQDTAGPMARTVPDAAVLLGAMAGGRSATTPRRDAGAQGQSRLHAVPRRRMASRASRIGVAAKPLPRATARSTHVIEAALADDEGRRRELIDPVEFPTLRQARRRGVRGAAVRVQSRHQRLPRDTRRRSAGAHARRPDRVQRAERRRRRCLTSARKSSWRPRRRGR